MSRIANKGLVVVPLIFLSFGAQYTELYCNIQGSIQNYICSTQCPLQYAGKELRDLEKSLKGMDFGLIMSEGLKRTKR